MLSTFILKDPTGSSLCCCCWLDRSEEVYSAALIRACVCVRVCACVCVSAGYYKSLCLAVVSGPSERSGFLQDTVGEFIRLNACVHENSGPRWFLTVREDFRSTFCLFRTRAVKEGRRLKSVSAITRSYTCCWTCVASLHGAQVALLRTRCQEMWKYLETVCCLSREPWDIQSRWSPRWAHPPDRWRLVIVIVIHKGSHHPNQKSKRWSLFLGNLWN